MYLGIDTNSGLVYQGLRRSRPASDPNAQISRKPS